MIYFYNIDSEIKLIRGSLKIFLVFKLNGTTFRSENIAQVNSMIL